MLRKKCSGNFNFNMKINIKINLWIITKYQAADKEIGFLTKSILKPYCRTLAMPTAWELTKNPFICIAYIFTYYRFKRRFIINKIPPFSRKVFGCFKIIRHAIAKSPQSWRTRLWGSFRISSTNNLHFAKFEWKVQFNLEAWLLYNNA